MQQLEEQLRGYGRWLEQRSDVTLSNVAGDGGAVGQPLLGNDGRGPDRPGVGRRLLGAGVAVLLAGVGFLAIADQRSDDGAVTAAGDEVTGDQDGTSAEVGTEETSTVLDLQNTPTGSSDGSAQSSTASAADGQTAESSSDPAPSADAGGTDSSNSDLADSTTTTTADASDDEDSPTTSADETSDSSQEEGSMTFMSPRPGTAIDLNLGATFQVAAVDGAASYTFVGMQNGTEVLRTTVTQPTFILPGQLAAFTAGWPLEAGLLTVDVAAADNSGTVLASETIEVALLAGGGPPRRGVPGQILPTIPTLPQD